MITAAQLARLLHEELDRDDWGDVEPYWIKLAGEPDPEDPEEDADHREQAQALREVFTRVAKKLNYAERDERERERVFKVGCEWFIATAPSAPIPPLPKCRQAPTCVGETPGHKSQYVLCTMHGREWTPFWIGVESRTKPSRLVTHLGEPCTISETGEIVVTEESEG